MLEPVLMVVTLQPQTPDPVSSYTQFCGSFSCGKTTLWTAYSVFVIFTQIPNTEQWLWLNHRGRVTHIRVGKLTSIASDNGLSPGRRQTIIWNIAGIMLIGPLGTNFSEILIKILWKNMFENVCEILWRKYVWKCLRNVGHFVSASMC